MRSHCGPPPSAHVALCLACDESGDGPCNAIGAEDTTAEIRPKESAQKPTLAAASKQRAGVIVELAILAVGTTTAFTLGLMFDWFENIARWVRAREPQQLDEYLVSVVFLMLGLSVFGFRRWREARTEVARSLHSQTALELLSQNLDLRVRQRTEELGNINQALKNEIAERELATEALRESERRMASMMSNVELVSLMLDDECRITYCNEYLLTLCGWRRDEVLGQNWVEWFLPPETQAHMNKVYLDLLANMPTAWHYENEILTRSGERRMIHWNNTLLRSTTGAVIGTASIGEDITQQIQQRHKIERLNRIRAVIGGINSAMLRLHDRDSLFQEACRVAAAEAVFPIAWVTALDPQTQKFEIIASHGDDAGSIDFIKQVVLPKIPERQRLSHRAALGGQLIVVNDLATEPAVASVREEFLHRGYRSCAAFPLFVEGEVVAVLLLLANEPNVFDAEEIELLEWLAADLSFALEHIEHAKRLEYLAHYDELTGLPNADLFRIRLARLVEMAQKDRIKVGVVVLDLMHFTQLNNSLGRHACDELLRMVARRLEEAFTGPCALGRIGGDTFAVASPRDDELSVNELRACLFDALTQPFSTRSGSVTVAVQAGIALFSNDGKDAGTVFKNAEAALKLAKSTDTAYVYYSSQLHERMAQRLVLEAQLRTALEARQFVLHYQPRVDIISGEMVGAEALIRWQHPERGLLLPIEFIALAEQTRLIVPIGAWVIDAACEQQAQWVAAGLGVVPVAVNLSSVQFEKDDLLHTIRGALAAHALEPRLLGVELTESAVMADPAAAAATLKSLRKLGVGVALDDFGTGYSSLAHLKRFPFDSVKIDRSFITDITSNPEDAAIASAIVAMAHRLNLKVVAEGVETLGQCNYLRTLGCDEMQGNLFSAAAPGDVFESYLRSGKRMTLPAAAPANQHTLLLVDDEPGIRAALTRMLRRDGYNIVTAATGSEGLEMLAINPVKVIISDQRMPGMSGTEFLDIVKQLYPDTIRIILSGYTDLDVVTESVNRGAVFKFLTKPWNDDLLRKQVREAFRCHQTESIH
jgi:diguanylate cyclase (GGDEF)-like protein/PAS domain S-box-containing protein